MSDPYRTLAEGTFAQTFDYKHCDQCLKGETCDGFHDCCCALCRECRAYDAGRAGLPHQPLRQAIDSLAANMPLGWKQMPNNFCDIVIELTPRAYVQLLNSGIEVEDTDDPKVSRYGRIKIVAKPEWNL